MTERMRVLLINPPALPGTTANREGAAGMGALDEHEGGFSYPPHTLAAVAATLRAAGYAVSALDAGSQSLPPRCDPVSSQACIRAIQEAQPQVIGVSVSWGTREADRCVFALLQRAGVRGRTVAFGPSARSMGDDLIFADHVLVGEPEGSFARLCERLAAGEDVPHVVTPAWLGAPGYNADGLLTDLDALPTPAWDLLPQATYTYLTVMSSRGCTAACSWCPYVVAQGHVHRARSAESVVAELRELVQRYQPQRVVFRDPVFAHDRARVEALCSAIVRDRVLKPGRNLRWECESRPDDLDDELVRMLHVAGCTGIKMGLETVERDVLVQQGRVADVAGVEAYLARVERVVAACRRHSVAARLFVLVGLPGQSVAGTRATAAFAERLRPQALTTKTLELYPGALLSGVDPRHETLDELAAPLLETQKIVRGAAGHAAPRWRRLVTRAHDRVWFALHKRRA
ncbi:MAG: radical SAM protein [Chloroflexi bacterium]|nr:radical SAM protein [Chloroflexota bacterium]